MPESSESDHLTERVVALPATDETYTNAITVAGEPGITAVGEVGFHIDAQTRNSLWEAFLAGKECAAGGPGFDQWIEEFIKDRQEGKRV